MTRLEAIPDRVALETERRLQAAVLDLLMGTGPERPQRKRNGRHMGSGKRGINQRYAAAAEYLALCRESRVRMETAA